MLLQVRRCIINETLFVLRYFLLFIQAIESALASGNADVVDTLLSRINGFLADNLKLGPVPSKSFLPRAMLSSRIAAVEATSGRLGSGWGCCIDCITERESSPVETAMSASSLLRALWLAGRRDSAALHMTQFWELVSQKREIGGEKMIVHMLEQVAVFHEVLFVVIMQYTAARGDDQLMRGGRGLQEAAAATA